MENSQSILELASEPSSDHARSLIRIYFESEWRSTRLDVLRSLGRFKDSRSFQFLVEVLHKNEDLAEQQLAVLALSQRKNSQSARFLRTFYEKAPDTLKAHIAYSLGQVQDEASVPLLLRDYETALSKQDLFWLRNIILALGELKVFSVLPKLHRLLTEQTIQDSSVLMAVLFALGRLERDATFLLSQEQKFFEDSLQFQIFQSALVQTQVRSQFKLEDYLSKIFTLAEPHPVLPLELRAFEDSEVEAGLELFELSQYWKRILFAVKGLKPEKRIPYYDTVLAFIRAQAAQLEATGQASLEHEKFFWEMIRYDSAIPVVLEWALKKKSEKEFLSWLEFVAPVTDWQTEVSSKLLEADAIQILNLWNEWALTQDQAKLVGTVEAWLKLKLSVPVRARLIRACAELKLESKVLAEQFLKELDVPDLRASALLALEDSAFFNEVEVLKKINSWTDKEKEGLALRILALKITSPKELSAYIQKFSLNSNLEIQSAVLKVLREHPIPQFENLLIDQLAHQNQAVELNAVIALKSYAESSVASEALIPKLSSKSAVVRGRALDSLCAHSALLAKKAVMEFLKKNLQDEFVVDKIYRSFDPQKKGGPAFADFVDSLLKENPDHPQWEKLVQLRDRLKTETTAPEKAAGAKPQKSEALKELDKSLIEVIPMFLKLDPMAQAALRAAEEPFRATEEVRNMPIDKAPTVLEYCKALDLILEKYLGQKILFPKLETSLHEFQTVWHKIGFIEDYPSADKVMTALGVKGKMDPDYFPLHKAKLMAATFFNGKIVQDRFKVFDGLRAWAVIFLVFARKLPSSTGGGAPLLKLPHANDEECISVAKRLMVLQDLRNPAAHRQTYTDINTVMTFRTEAVQLLNTILKFYD